MSTAFAAATATTPAKATTKKVSSSAAVPSSSEKTVSEISSSSSVAPTIATNTPVTVVSDRVAENNVITETTKAASTTATTATIVATTIAEQIKTTTTTATASVADLKSETEVQHILCGLVQDPVQLGLLQRKVNTIGPLIPIGISTTPPPPASQVSTTLNDKNQERNKQEKVEIEEARKKVSNERRSQTDLKQVRFFESPPAVHNTCTTNATTELRSPRRSSFLSEKKDKCSAVNNSESSYPRPAGGYKYSMEFLYTIGRNMTGVTLNIPTPISITPRALRSPPANNNGPHTMIPSLMATLPAPTPPNTSNRYGSGNSYIFQTYVPTSSQRRLWHSENAMWQYDRNYPYNQPYGTSFGVPAGMVSLGYDATQYGSQRFIYPSYYQPPNYHNTSRSSPPLQHQQQSASVQQQHQPLQQSQSPPLQNQQTQLVNRNASVSSTSIETSDVQQHAETHLQTLSHQNRPDSPNQLETQARGGGFNSQTSSNTSAWRYNSRQNNRERYGSGRTMNNSTVVSNPATFCESKSYYNSGGRYKNYDPTRNQRSNNSSENIHNTSSSTNNTNSNNINSGGIKFENDNNNKGSQRSKGTGNIFYAKRNKKTKDSSKTKDSNSSRSHSSSSHDSNTRLRSSDENAKSPTNKSDITKNFPINTNLSGPNYRPYYNRSYRNRIRYNSELEQQPQQTNVTNSRTTFHNRQAKRSDQHSSGYSKTSTTSVDSKSPNHTSRYYHSRQNEPAYQPNRNYINYPCTYAAEQQPTEEYVNSMQVPSSSKMPPCNIEMYAIRTEINDIEGSITSVTSNEDSDGPSYASCDIASTCPSSESSMSKESVVSMVQTIAYNCFARATGMAVPNLAGPNWVPFGDITRFFEAEDRLRQQNGFKHAANMEIPASEVARIGKCEVSYPAQRPSSSDQNEANNPDSPNSARGSEATAPSPENNNPEQKPSEKKVEPLLPCLHDCHGYTPADRFLARSHLIEMKHPPHNLLINSKWDSLAQCVWNKFMNAQQNEKVYRLKMRLWRFIYLVIMAKYPRYGVYLVGSSISNFGANGSDIDMCLLASTNTTVDPRMEAVYHLQLIRDCLYQTTEFEDFNLIEARVPILRFTDRQNKVEVDINFNNSVGIRNTHLLYCYSQLEWRLRPLVLVIKQWAQYHNINNAKNMTISSYSLVLMVIHFLQAGVCPPVLPCLHKIYPEKFTLLSPTDFGYVDMNEIIEPFDSSNKQSIGELILEFLRYYTFFEYNQYAISVRVGGLLPIEVCRTAKAAKNDIHQWNELCIEEPFDQTNTARSVYDAETFERIKTIIAASWRLLDQTHHLQSIFEGYVGPMVLIPETNEPEPEAPPPKAAANESAAKENNAETTKPPKPLMVDKSVVALIRDGVIENCTEQTNVEPSLAAAKNTVTLKEPNTEAPANKTTVESVAEPLETIGIKPGT